MFRSFERIPGSLVVFLLGSSLVLGLGGCEKGPAERVGEKIDRATGQQSGTQRAGDKLEDAAKDVQDAGKEAGKDVKRAVNDPKK
jgi:hypothetical protein